MSVSIKWTFLAVAVGFCAWLTLSTSRSPLPDATDIKSTGNDTSINSASKGDDSKDLEDEQHESSDTAGLRPDGEVRLTPMLSEVSKAIEENDENFFSRLNDEPNCAECDEIYADLSKRLAANPSGPALKLIATALAQSERPELVSALVSAYRVASEEDQATLAHALELATGGDQVSAVLSSVVTAEESFQLRNAALMGLTGMSDPVAAEALLKYGRAVGDGKGGYDRGVGLGEFIPNNEAMPVLQRTVRDGSPEAPLAVRSLFNAGVEGTKIAMDSIAAISNEAEQRRLLDGAQSHVVIEPETLDYLKSLSRNENLSPTLKSFIQEILTRDIRE